MQWCNLCRRFILDSNHLWAKWHSFLVQLTAPKVVILVPLQFEKLTVFFNNLQANFICWSHASFLSTSPMLVNHNQGGVVISDINRWRLSYNGWLINDIRASQTVSIFSFTVFMVQFIFFELFNNSSFSDLLTILLMYEVWTLHNLSCELAYVISLSFFFSESYLT